MELNNELKNLLENGLNTHTKAKGPQNYIPLSPFFIT